VFLTCDVDVLDPSIMPATGAPEPGGLLWHHVLDVVRTVAQHGRVIGCDCVELCPAPGLHAPDFTAARLVYKMIGYVMSSRRSVEAGSKLLSEQQGRGGGADFLRDGGEERWSM
jgi:arginase family enzyme